MSSFNRKLSQVLARFHEIEALMSAGNLASDKFTQLSKEYAELTPVCALITLYQKAIKEQQELEPLMSDKEMRDMAEADFYALKEKIPKLEKDIQLALLPKDAADEKNAILEIRAGTGGDEAALFAADLFGMYKGYAT